MGLWAERQAVPAVRGDDSVEENGAGREAHILVPSLPAVTRRHGFPLNVPVLTHAAEPNQPAPANAFEAGAVSPSVYIRIDIDLSRRSLRAR